MLKLANSGMSRQMQTQAGGQNTSKQMQTQANGPNRVVSARHQKMPTTVRLGSPPVEMDRGCQGGGVGGDNGQGPTVGWPENCWTSPTVIVAMMMVIGGLKRWSIVFSWWLDKKWLEVIENAVGQVRIANGECGHDEV